MHPAASKARFEEEVANFSSSLAARRGWTFHSLDYPLIDCSFAMNARTPIRLRLTCDDWNDRPPSITLHVIDGTLITAAPTNPSGIFHPSPHPVTSRYFVCMRGTREYHTHPSHVGDSWDALKNGSSFTLGGILTQVWSGWQKGTS
jgi:hypothetical protein